MRGRTLESMKKAVESMFTDRCKVWAWVEKTEPWGETKVVKQEPPREFFGRVCRTPKGVEGRACLPTVAENSGVLLFPREEVIDGGSFVTVETVGGTLSFVCGGQMVCYKTHNEIALEEKDVL